MQGNFKTLVKNVKNFIPGSIAIASQGFQAFATWRKIYDRAQKYAPEDYVDQAEVYPEDYKKKQLCQKKNFWVDPNLSEEVTQKELAQLMSYKIDFWRVAHVSWVTAAFGGYALPVWLFWLANDTHTPRQFNQTKEELAEWRAAQDLYRYKYAPTLCRYFAYGLDYHGIMNFPEVAALERGWFEIQEKNNVRRDPNLARQAIGVCDYNGYWVVNHWWRWHNKLHARPMGIPTYPIGSRTCLTVRIRDYWTLAWNEDLMVIKGKLLDTMSDEEVYDYAWRRFLSPYDLNLTREQNLQRINDYFTFLGKDFVEHQVTPNLNALQLWCHGHYNEPAFLVDDISELDNNDYDNLKTWSADTFLRRLEFENGPLRDQIEAHSHKLLEARKQAAAEATK